MAAVVQGEGGDEHEVRAWLARALHAPRGEMWVCASCNHLHSKWAPLCENCDALDSLSWTKPSESAASDMPAAMLALLAQNAVSDVDIEDSANIHADYASDEDTLEPDMDDDEQGKTAPT